MVDSRCASELRRLSLLITFSVDVGDADRPRLENYVSGKLNEREGIGEMR